VLDKPLDSLNAEGSFPPGPGSQLQHQTVGDGSSRSGSKPWQKVKPSTEILCNNQASYVFLSKQSHALYIFSFLDAKIEQVHALFFMVGWPTIQFMHMLFRICSLFLQTFLVTHCVVSCMLLKFRDIILSDFLPLMF
jgi:hypothetical protein